MILDIFFCNSLIALSRCTKFRSNMMYLFYWAIVWKKLYFLKERGRRILIEFFESRYFWRKVWESWVLFWNNVAYIWLQMYDAVESCFLCETAKRFLIISKNSHLGFIWSKWNPHPNDAFVSENEELYPEQLIVLFVIP
jgi:hypothetical protein